LMHMATDLPLVSIHLLITSLTRSLSNRLRERVEHIIHVRATYKLLPTFWHVLRNHPYSDDLLRVAARVASAVKTPSRHNLSTIERLQSLLAPVPFGPALLDDIADSGLDLSTWCHDTWPDHLRVNIRSPLYYRLCMEILINGSRVLLQRHDKATLMQWFEQIDDRIYDLAAYNLIDKLDIEQIDQRILESCVNRHGLPAKGGRFWHGIDHDKLLAIQRLIGEKMICDFFESADDPEDRFSFWRIYVPLLVDMHYPINKSRVLLDFGRFLVVEFRDLGNAVYIYPHTMRDWIVPVVMSSSHNGACKDRSSTIIWLTHGGRWRERAAEALDHIIRQA